MTAGREAVRRLLHISLGFGAYALPHIGWRWTAVLCAAGLLGVLLLVPNTGLRHWIHRPAGRRGAAGLAAYPLTLMALLGLFQDWHEPVQAGWIALAIGDGLCPFLRGTAPVRAWPWNPDKEVLATLLAFSAAAAAMLPALPPGAALAAALCGAAAETLPGTEDNVTIPVAGAIACALWLGAAA